MRLLGLWSQRQRGWLRRGGVAWARSSKSKGNRPASETPPCGVTRESVWGWVVDLKSTCSCTTASSPVRRCCGRQYISTPSIYCSLVTHCLGTSRVLQRWFFPLLTRSRSHETQKVKSLKRKEKKNPGSLTKEMIKKITWKQIMLHQVPF